ncbi:DUF4238 domain-containing protein [Henriciella mobilis]|uniref:DUF4238 domain-containing protein n=1 Tax=Henriciella mobilis TaxID=2305467 RepID=A0A399RCM3_9PROT|nr:DUF4238 domain-containing protein [Henriciella mobilis]RIJ28443.1 DUF4238 domain-containing protein [Henriciella mobilis]
MNVPKRHHFVPQWLMKHWSNGGSSVFGVDRRDREQLRAFKSDTKNVNVQRHLYSYERSDGTKDARLETELYAKMDGAAADLTAQIISILDDGKLPDLDEPTRTLLWQFYIYNAKKRLPGTWDEYLNRIDHDAIRQSTIEAAITAGHDPDEVRREVASVQFDEKLQTLSVQKARAAQSEEVLEALGKIGVQFLVAPDGASFILPDDAFDEIVPKAEESIALFVPIHPKYAISPYGEKGECVRAHIDKKTVRAINERWYRRSTTVISTSTQLLKSLAKRQDSQTISFDDA